MKHRFDTVKPLSKRMFVASRLLALVLLLGALASIGVTYAFNDRLTLPYRVALGVLTVLFGFGLRDVKALTHSYAQYLREWGEVHGRSQDPKGIP